MGENRRVGTDAYKIGYRAFFEGRLDNPYPEDTWFGKEWIRGFNTAYYKGKEKAPQSLTAGLHSDIVHS